MSPESILDQLELLGTVDAKIIGKLRKRLADPEKETTTKKIITFLVKNDLITKQQAKELQSGGAAKQPRDATDDLLAGVLDPVEAKPEEPIEEAEVAELDEPEAIYVDEQATIMPEAVHAEDLVETQIKTAALEPMDIADPYAGQVEDPMATWDDSLAADVQESPKKAVGFTGKKDTRDQWATKWVFIGFATLGLLLVAGTLLFFVLSFISAEDRFEAAMKSFNDGTYGDAIKKFDEFLEKHPSHKNIPIAQATRVQALLADTYKQKNWDETIVRAEKFLPPLVNDEEIDLETIRQDLAVMLPNATLQMAKRATKQEAKSELVTQLDKAKHAKSLVDNPVYVPNSKRKQAAIAKLLDDIDEEIAKGDGLIRKQEDFDNSMRQITSLRESGETDKAFEIYNTLIRSYGDLKANKTLQAEMRQVSQIEAQLVKPNPSTIATQNSERQSPIQSSVVLAAQTGSAIRSLAGEVIPILADGSVYGIDLANGEIRWRRFVGYQTFVQPTKTGPNQILLADQSNDDLVLVNASDGNVVWRSEVGERFLDPQVDENLIYLTTESGKLYQIELATGNVQHSVKIPQNANVPMARAPRSGLIFQPGSYSNLYVLSEDDLSCQDVIYLGHHRGSIAVPPVVWNNYILVAENDSGVCDLNVLLPNKETDTIDLVQRITRITRGNVINPLIRFGRFMLINSESGDLKILELNTAEEANPIRVLAEEKFENSDADQIFVATAGSQLWIGSEGLMLYKVSRSLGTFDRQKLANPDDSFIGPIRKIGDSIVHIRKRKGSALTSVSAVDATSLEQIWRTDLGGPLAGPPIVLGNRLAAISSQGDLFSIATGVDSDQIAGDEVKSSNIVEHLLFDETISLSDTTSVCLGPPGRAEILYVDAQNGKSKLIRLPAPANNAACRSIQIDGDLIIPSKKGKVLRVDPSNGRIVGTPFLPPVDPGETISWRQPAATDNGMFVVGANENIYLIDASDKSILRRVGQTTFEGQLKSPFVANGNLAFGVFKSKTVEKLVAIRTSPSSIEVAGSVDLPNRIKNGPWAINGQVYLRLDNDELVSFDSSLAQTWRLQLPRSSLATKPLLENGTLQLYFSSGKRLSVSNQSGAIESEFDLGQPIVHPPTFIDGKAIFTGSDGTLHNINSTQ